MPKIAYIEARGFKQESIDLIQWADRVATDYKRRGYDLTLRQLYYQGVTDNRFPNSERSYTKLKNFVNQGRLVGMIDWDHLVDRGRNAHGTGWFGHIPREIPEIIRDAQWDIALDMWETQPRRIEVWVEKQALEQVAERAVSGYRMGYIACKGYMSASEMWAAGHRRFRQYARSGQTPLILHLGDHDPSGIDMTRDIQERMSMFAGADVEVRRIALNMEQIDEFNPPPNPAKTTDSRFKEYSDLYGDESWELDSITPERLESLIKGEIEAEIDWDAWGERKQEEKELRQPMIDIADRWEEIETYLTENPI